jgi:hypothetical protein
LEAYFFQVRPPPQSDFCSQYSKKAGKGRLPNATVTSQVKRRKLMICRGFPRLLKYPARRWRRTSRPNRSGDHTLDPAAHISGNKTGTFAQEMLYVDNRGSSGVTVRGPYRVDPEGGPQPAFEPVAKDPDNPVISGSGERRWREA